MRLPHPRVQNMHMNVIYAVRNRSKDLYSTRNAQSTNLNANLTLCQDNAPTNRATKELTLCVFNRSNLCDQSERDLVASKIESSFTVI